MLLILGVPYSMERDKFIAQGKEFGLSGLELKEFVDECGARC